MSASRHSGEIDLAPENPIMLTVTTNPEKFAASAIIMGQKTAKAVDNLKKGVGCH